ncbi:MAG: M43 family zinc metalloprotease [Candidatus Zixiibacteriota bacterium]
MPCLLNCRDLKNRLLLVALGLILGTRGGSSAETIKADSLNWCGTQKKFDDELRVLGLGAASAAYACPEYGPCDNPDTRDGWIPDPGAPITRVRLAIHVLANSDGSSPFTTPASVQNAVNLINQHYAPSRIQFDHVFDQVNFTEWRLLSEYEIDNMKTYSAFDATRWLNVWVTSVDYGYSFGTFPFSSDALGPTGGIVLGHFHWGGNFSTFAHEIGHCLGLWHTFHGVTEVNRCGPCYEFVGAANRDVLGDMCEDTPPTNVWYECNSATGVDSCTGQPWGFTQPENIMGYTPSSCRTMFTPQQQARMRCWIDDKLSGWISGVLIQADTLFGPAPLGVNITALTFRQVNSWSWDMGDQTIINLSAASHTYAQPGMYTVGVAIQTPDGPFSDTRPDLVWAYADTVALVTGAIVPEEPVRVDISVRNFVPMSELLIPITWTAGNSLRLDSISTAGLRGETFDTRSLVHVNNTLRQATLLLVPDNDGQTLLPPDYGPVAALYFTPQEALRDTTSIAVTSYDSYAPFFATPVGLYQPSLLAGEVYVRGCCRDRVGDANNSGDDEPTVGDVAAIIDMLYINGTAVDCMAEADVNQSGGPDPSVEDITVGDVSALIDYLFITGPSLGLPDCL